ncbi:ATP-binding cassette domain-containing protein [Shewanella sp.]|uniref:ATP-binding cassette domain-containing protein n=1 Tax=Shewanella sp. TaxID=50422 RepID=UPI0040537C8E
MLDLVKCDIGYGPRIVLPKLNLTLAAGERVAILGPSGSGKSTLLKHLHQILKSKASFCAQSQTLVDNLSVYHNIFMGALGRHNVLYNIVNLLYPFKQNRQEITQLCLTLELDCELQQQVEYLSGGQRQRVALGRAIYQQQALFLGDEPFSALDPAMGERLLQQVFDAHQSVICVLHDPIMAMKHFDRIILLQEGTKTFDGPATTLSQAHLQACYDHDLSKKASDLPELNPLNQHDPDEYHCVR